MLYAIQHGKLGTLFTCKAFFKGFIQRVFNKGFVQAQLRVFLQSALDDFAGYGIAVATGLFVVIVINRAKL